jgi:hypothetical protein
LKRKPEFGANKKVGAAVGVSGEIVREFLTLLDLPETIQKLFAKGGLGLEQGRRLWQVSRARPGDLASVAAVIGGMAALEARDFVDYFLRHPELTAMEAKDRLAKSKTVVEDEYHVVALLSREEFQTLMKKARARRVSPDALVSIVIRGWLKDASHGT